MRATSEKGQKPKVIGRAYAGEPISLLIVADRGRTALVVAESESEPRPIGFKKDWLYSFKPELFAKLRSAYQAGNGEQLSHLWATAEHYSP